MVYLWNHSSPFDYPYIQRRFLGLLYFFVLFSIIKDSLVVLICKRERKRVGSCQQKRVAPFSWIFNSISRKKSWRTSLPFLSTNIWRHESWFSRFLTPDWTIQISGALAMYQPRPLSSYLKKLPWLRLVTCLCVQIKSAPGVGLWLNCVKTVYGGESCFPSQTLFWKLIKLFVRDPAWPVLRFYQNFYEYEMLIEREVCLFSLLTF